jgi:hypothetical protein
MTEYSKVVRGTFTSTGVNKPLYFPFKPDMIEIWNKTKYGTTTNQTGVSAVGFAEDNAGTAYLTNSNGTTWLGNVLTSGGFTFFSAGSPTYGAVQVMSGAFATAANPVNITVTAHGYQTGDVVVVYGTTGMLQIAGTPYVITRVDANNFTIPVNGSGFAAAATAGSVKQLFYPDLYIPEACTITAITQATSAVITTSVNHSFVVGQEVAFTIPSQWGMVQLSTAYYLRNISNGIPQQAYVTAVTANTVTVNINSTGFTAFSYPTSAITALGVSPAQIMAIGDQNTGYTYTNAQVPYLGIKNGVIGIPGAFAANTRQGVIVGTGNGTQIIHANNDVVAFRVTFPDAVLLSQ